MPGAEPRVACTPVRALLGDYPTTHALRQGELTSPLLALQFADVEVPNQAFKRVVRDLEFDVAELALMTFLMARSRGIPLRLLPVVVFSRNPLPHLVCNAERRRITPGELRGCRIGVRAYATTTAVWIRALIADQLGVALDGMEWMTLEDGHVAGVPDPPTAHRVHTGDDLVTMLRGGLIDAAIVDRVPPGPSIVPVVPDPEATWCAWRQRHRAQTLNHVVVVREPLAEDGDAMSELFRLFRDSRQSAGAAAELDRTPLGLEANRRNLEVAIAAADAQGLLARPLTVGDLVTDAVASLQ